MLSRARLKKRNMKDHPGPPVNLHIPDLADDDKMSTQTDGPTLTKATRRGDFSNLRATTARIFLRLRSFCRTHVPKACVESVIATF